MTAYKQGEAVYLGVWSPDSASAVWHLVGTPGTWQRCYAAPCMTMLQRHSCPCPSPSAAGLPKVSAASLVKGVVSKSACAPSKLKGPSLGPFEGQKCLPCLLCALCTAADFAISCPPLPPCQPFRRTHHCWMQRWGVHHSASCR